MNAIKKMVVKKASSRTRIEEHCVIGLFMETWDTLSQVIKVHENGLGYGQWPVTLHVSVVSKHKILLKNDASLETLLAQVTLCFISPEED